MAGIDQIKTDAKDICWARGDNDPKIFTVKVDDVPFDISGWTLSMAVNTEQNPLNTNNEVFVVTGVFVTDGTDGQISFTPPANSLDNVTAPGVAYYDINRVTPSKKTLIKGTVLFVQDIDKV